MRKLGVVELLFTSDGQSNIEKALKMRPDPDVLVTVNFQSELGAVRKLQKLQVRRAVASGLQKACYRHIHTHTHTPRHARVYAPTHTRMHPPTHIHTHPQTYALTHTCTHPPKHTLLSQPKKPAMVMEFWSGWFDHWGEKHLQRDLSPAELAKTTFHMLQEGASINFYMFHGRSFVVM